MRYVTIKINNIKAKIGERQINHTNFLKFFWYINSKKITANTVISRNFNNFFLLLFIKTLIDNIKHESYEVEKGQRLFQLVSMDWGPVYFELVDILSTSKRGEGGFGSTGK